MYQNNEVDKASKLLDELGYYLFSDTEKKDYDSFLEDIISLFSEPGVDEVFIDAKIGEESEYQNSKNPLLIRKIEEYSVDEIIE